VSERILCLYLDEYKHKLTTADRAGVANDFTSAAARHCRNLIVEVNRNMPRVFGDSLIHVSKVSAIVENDAPIIEAAVYEPEPVSLMPNSKAFRQSSLKTVACLWALCSTSNIEEAYLL